MTQFFSIMFGAFVAFCLTLFIIGLVIMYGVDSGRLSYTTKCRDQGGIAVKAYSSNLVCIPSTVLLEVK